MSHDQKEASAHTRAVTPSPANNFPVVCVGGSAGGLDAYIRLLQNLPADKKLDTAKQPGMPQSAIASGCIDFVLSPENIAAKTVRIARMEV